MEMKNVYEMDDVCYIIAKHPLSKSQTSHLTQEQEKKEAYYKKIFDEIAERKRLAEIREDNELRDRMG